MASNPNKKNLNSKPSTIFGKVLVWLNEGFPNKDCKTFQIKWVKEGILKKLGKKMERIKLKKSWKYQSMEIS